MRIKGVFKILATGVVFFAAGTIAVLSLSACTHESASAENTSDDTSIAATVNGVDIRSSEVDEYIDSFRSTSDVLSSDEGWQNYLKDHDYTDETYRKDVALESLISRTLVQQAAEKAGIEVDEDYIDSEIDALKSRYETDEAWTSALSSCGYTEDSYRQQLGYSYIAQRFKETIDVPPATQEQIQDYCNEHAKEYVGKRYSQILFGYDEEDLAVEVHDDLVSSDNRKNDFIRYVQEYSEDSSSKVRDGDVGWSSLVDCPVYCSSALDSLAVGDVSDSIQTSYGYLLIYCTDEFMVPEGDNPVDITGIPTDIYDALMNSLEEDLRDTAFDKYVQNLRDSADVVIY